MTTLREPVQGLSSRRSDRAAALAGVTADRYTSTIGQARTALLGGILDDTVFKTSSIFADAANAAQGLSGLRADRTAAL
ncbi:hypothetical protein, partial [Nocardioides sp. AX2bis]|uniref:hypothetical protein n=1 Tax=Nocardioides sp. AX2bis TaxID=2653157 RepID=UPI001359E3F7